MPKGSIEIKGTKRENIIIALLIIIIISIGILGYFSIKKSSNKFENVVYPKGANCEEIIDYFSKEKNLDIRQPICTYSYQKDQTTGKNVVTRCTCNLIYCDYTIYGRIKGIKECSMKQIELNTTLIGEINGGQFVK